MVSTDHGAVPMNLDGAVPVVPNGAVPIVQEGAGAQGDEPDVVLHNGAVPDGNIQ